MKTLCIYHGNCADGFGAAWVVAQHYGPENVELFAATYGGPPPDVTGRRVVMVDFSYKRPVMEHIIADCEWLLVLDHHKTARDDLAGLVCGEKDVEIVFDMGRSGAMLAWDYFNPGKPPLPLIKHIQDRDLWQFAHPGTREIQANLFSYPYELGVWTNLMHARTDTMMMEGAAIERKHHKDIAELLAAQGQMNMEIGGYLVPVANLPYIFSSDAGHVMSKGHEYFAACYWDKADVRVFSLRSDPVGGMDVSLIAKEYGGGGHPNASGFSVPHDHPLATWRFK